MNPNMIKSASGSIIKEENENEETGSNTKQRSNEQKSFDKEEINNNYIDVDDM